MSPKAAVPSSITKATEWLKLFNAKLIEKYGHISGSNRAAYWRFLVKSMGLIKNSEPVTRVIAVVGIAIHANIPMLPPQAYSGMMRSVGQTTGFNLVVAPVDASNDKNIPDVVAQAIQGLPSVDSEGVSPLPAEVRKYLIDRVYKDLKSHNKHIGVWVHGSGGELSYWEKDFDDLAEELAVKLGLTQEERSFVDEIVVIELQGRKRRSQAAVMNMMQGFAQTTME
jgi:hypothetical protein